MQLFDEDPADIERKASSGAQVAAWSNCGVEALRKLRYGEFVPAVEQVIECEGQVAAKACSAWTIAAKAGQEHPFEYLAKTSKWLGRAAGILVIGSCYADQLTQDAGRSDLGPVEGRSRAAYRGVVEGGASWLGGMGGAVFGESASVAGIAAYTAYMYGAAGTAVAPGLGTLVGGIIGGIVGGMAGGMALKKLAKAFVDETVDQVGSTAATATSAIN